MGYRNVTHHFLQCDWCVKEEEYPEGRDAKIALPDWLIGRTHYKTNRGESPVTLCPSCAKIYDVATQGVRTPRGIRFRAYMDTFFACEALIEESIDASKIAATKPECKLGPNCGCDDDADDDDPFGMED